eukprot:sb/3471670/
MGVSLTCSLSVSSHTGPKARCELTLSADETDCVAWQGYHGAAIQNMSRHERKSNNVIRQINSIGEIAPACLVRSPLSPRPLFYEYKGGLEHTKLYRSSFFYLPTPDLLEAVSQALRLNNISFTRCVKNKNSIRRVRTAVEMNLQISIIPFINICRLPKLTLYRGKTFSIRNRQKQVNSQS